MAAISNTVGRHPRERRGIQRLGSALASIAGWAWFLLTSATNARSELRKVSGERFLTWGD